MVAWDAKRGLKDCKGLYPNLQWNKIMVQWFEPLLSIYQSFETVV